MCTVSMIGDYYTDKWSPRYPELMQPQTDTNINLYTWISKQEFEELKKEVQELKALLVRAKIYDEEHGEPNCEMDEKVALLKKIAEVVGVDLSEVFK